MLKRQNAWNIWHRCRICGTVFSSKQELHEHQDEHKGRAMPSRLQTVGSNGARDSRNPQQWAYHGRGENEPAAKLELQ